MNKPILIIFWEASAKATKPMFQISGITGQEKEYARRKAMDCH